MSIKQINAAVASITSSLAMEYEAETDKMVWILETFFPGFDIDSAEKGIIAVEDAINAR